jgi:hypothetical protein
MYLSGISILFFAVIVLINNISAMPFPPGYPTDDSQVNSNIYNDEMQQVAMRPEGFASWLYKRNSPLCDYRLQFRPLPLTSALCGYG